jgi:hypothetical protein
MSWLPWVSCALGAWAAVAPFVFPWDVCTWVWIAGVIPGALVFLLSGGYVLRPQKSLAWLNWIAAVLGLWLIVSPFVAGYTIVFDVVWSNFLPGVLIVLCSGLTGYFAMKAE